jgi:asparagine synthase (glutamine-hydrolysing)
VAVSYSGGLDSLIVLWHALQVSRRTGQEVIAVHANLRDDSGVWTAPAALECAARLIADADLHIVDGRDASRGLATWSSRGPDLSALPGVGERINALAAAKGATLLLTGDGADELLGAPEYLGFEAAGLPMYAVDTLAEDGLLSGAWAVAGMAIGRRLPNLVLRRRPRRRAQDSTVVLTAPFQVAAIEQERYHRRCVEPQLVGDDWASTDLWRMVFPHDAIQAGRVLERSPFLHGPFVETALGVAPRWRYDGCLDTAYQRRKPLAFALLPHAERDRLGRWDQKATFAAAFTDHASRQSWPQTTIDLGLIEPSAVSVCTDPEILAVVTAVEVWCQQALDRGFSIYAPNSWGSRSSERRRPTALAAA